MTKRESLTLKAQKRNDVQHKQTSLQTRENVKAYIEFIRTSGFPFSMTVSNYTTEIKSEVSSRKFVQSMRSNQMFAAYAKIKGDVKGKPLPSVDKGSLNYYGHSFLENRHYENVLNIDLKSAYATALYNEGILSEATNTYLSKIPKLDRLAAVGMLASRKVLFNYDENGNLVNFQKIVAPTENFFYFAVQRVENIMNDIRLILKDDYLFSWVDGIYFDEKTDSLPEIHNYLSEKNYPYTIERLLNFDVKITPSQTVKIQYIKDGKEKFFNIPAKPNGFARDIVSYLLTNKTKSNGSRKNKSKGRGTACAF